MNEQAAALQEYIRRANLGQLVRSRRASADHDRRIVTVSSGKGGVGKSAIALNLGVTSGENTLVVDGDFLLGNLGVMQNAAPETSWEDLLLGRMHWTDALHEVDHNTSLLLAESFDSERTLRRTLRSERLSTLLQEWQQHYELIIIDTSAGLGSAVIEWCLAATHTMVVTTPDPTAITDAYALIKTLILSESVSQIGILVNQFLDDEEPELVHQQLLALARKYLDEEIACWGGIPWNETFVQSARNQTVASLGRENTSLAQYFARSCEALKKQNRTLNAAIAETTG